MPRLNTVKKAAKDQGNCGGCGKPIKKGMPYKWIKCFRGPKQIKCESCKFRPSEFTTSKMGAIYDAQEDTHNAISEWDGQNLGDLTSHLECLAETVREVSQEYQDSADNIREHFQESETADELEEKAQNLEGWADDIENVSLEEFDEEGAEEEAKEEAEDQKDVDAYSEEDIKALIEEKRESWANDLRSEADSIVDECPE
jgi:hypothetical protein